jgi:gliding motility-associated-like protein
MRLLRCLLILIALLTSNLANATHNRAGEITYRHLGGFQYEATIITYTKADSPADRPELGISWGDGSIDTIPRTNGFGQGEIVTGTIKKNIYIGIHTYPGPAAYVLSFEDPNRNGGVVNIPNSVNIPFFVSTTLIINPFLGINNSVQLLNPPIDEACPGQIFIHNAGAYDPDGDSISYRIVQCRGEGGLVVPGFTQPQTSNSFSIDAISGDLVWDSPLPSGLGEYNVAFVIEEWRNGILIGSVTRDMQINVVPCNNLPPVIAELPDICVDAGTEINFQVFATNPDNTPPQSITLSASGGPFQFPNPGQAQFGSVTSSNGVVSQTFNWATNCSHVRKQPYVFSFKAIDNGDPNLADYETVQVKVVAQAPENLLAIAVPAGVQLTWETSPCPQAIGYAIYRRSGSYPFSPGPCETGVPAYTGYTFLTNIIGVGQLTYLDATNGLLPGNAYCYRIIARFIDGAESYSSNETCLELPENLPVITNVSIRETDNAQGSVFVAWSRPDDLDTTVFTGPFTYSVERFNPSTSQFDVAGNTIGLNDTTFVDSTGALDTRGVNKQYRIRLLHGDLQNPDNVGISSNATSVYLSAQPTDNTISLSWTFNVPWNNNLYTIYRKESTSTQFDSIAVSTNRTYQDTGLANGFEYCYLVKSVGSYSSNGFVNPIENFSQEVCASAIDNIPPCPPVVYIDPSCDSLYNLIYWQFGPFGCIEDIVNVQFQFVGPGSSSMVDLPDLMPSNHQPTIHFPGTGIAGCYLLTSVDSFMNKSEVVKVCVDNCPIYNLPNTFSPNGDGVNDLFGPFPYAFIESVDFRVFDRWGLEVFSTEDKNLNWNGRINSTGGKLPDGVYYYICIVNEQRLAGIIPRTIKGTIQLFGTNQSNKK